jgi:hypothetical protein
MMVPYAQIFVGRNSLVLDADATQTLSSHGHLKITSEKGSDEYLSATTKAEVSLKSQDICRTLFIQTWQSEPHFQHQNYCEKMGKRKPM